MGLRLREGVDLSDVSRRSGLDVPAAYAGPISANVRRGLLTVEDGRLRATPAGWWSLNRVVADFLEIELHPPFSGVNEPFTTPDAGD